MEPGLDFEIIYQKYHSKILRYLTRLIGPFHAEDITQEVFSKVNNNLITLKKDSKLSSWLYRIATNTAIDKTRSLSFKHSKNNKPGDEKIMIQDGNTWTGEKRSSTDQSLIKKEMRGCVQEFIDRLPKDYRAVLILREYEGRNNKEIAQILDISIHTAKIRYHRAKEMLKKELDSGCDFYVDDENRLLCDRKQTSSIFAKLPQ